MGQETREDRAGGKEPGRIGRGQGTREDRAGGRQEFRED